ncbi:hypothetical protein D3C71_1568900 [compost metagenome]
MSLHLRKNPRRLAGHGVDVIVVCAILQQQIRRYPILFDERDQQRDIEGDGVGKIRICAVLQQKFRHVPRFLADRGVQRGVCVEATHKIHICAVVQQYGDNCWLPAFHRCDQRIAKHHRNELRVCQAVRQQRIHAMAVAAADCFKQREGPAFRRVGGDGPVER